MTSVASVVSVVSDTVSRTARTRTGTGRTARRRLRLAAATGGLAAALVLTACSSDGDSGEDSGSEATPSVTATADSGGGTGGSGGSGDASGAPAGALEGSWLATTDGKAVALVVTGEQAGLFATGGTVCSGTAREDGGTHTITLDCGNGDDDRAKGSVEAVDKSTLKVTWEGTLGTETYTKAEGGSLPTGLPTTGLGS